MRQPQVLGWIAASALLALLANVSAEARLVATPQMTATSEVLAMVEGWVKDHPHDAAGYYALGRVHALAWAYGDKVPVVWGDRKQLPSFGEYTTIRIARDGAMVMDPWGTPVENRGAATPEDLAHVQASIEAYAKALAIDPDNALYEEGLGWMLQRKGLAGVAMVEDVKYLAPEQKEKYAAAISHLASADFAQREEGSKLLLQEMPRSAGALKTVKTDDPEVTSRIAAVFIEYGDLQALPHYRHAYALTLKKDLENQNGFGGGPDRLISFDAAEQSLKILGEHGNEARKGEVAELKQAVQLLGEQKQKAMVIFDF